MGKASNLNLQVHAVNEIGLILLNAVAAAMGKHPRTLKRWAQLGKFPRPVQLGASLYLSKKELDDHVARQMKQRDEPVELARLP